MEGYLHFIPGLPPFDFRLPVRACLSSGPFGSLGRDVQHIHDTYSIRMHVSENGESNLSVIILWTLGFRKNPITT